MKVFSMKIDEERYDALTLLAEHNNTTKNALLIEAVDAILAGGINKVLDAKIQGCLSHILGFNDKAGFDEAVEEKYGSMLVDLIDARLKVVHGLPMDQELQEGSLAALNRPQAPRPKASIDIPKALKLLEEQLELGPDISLNELAQILDVDKQNLSTALSKAGVKTERKRVGSERKRFYMQDELEKVKNALERYK
jgi:hypothetical protein